MQEENHNSMPIAIVGMAFRFPGDLSDVRQFWQALCAGQDCVSQIPEDRWAVNELQHPRRSEAGRSITFSAGVLSRIDEFDAGFFGISPREAAWLDPQHRLLLELSWEAMENAGLPPSSLAGSNCSVYVGISGYDYGVRHVDDMSSMGAHTMTGNTLSVAANRISYVFDLHGPSLAVDTACSSSLVALHHACNSLRHGEADMALAGGVNLLLHPYPFIGFSKASMLSAGGRCKTFDESGDGYVRAEGGAVLLLKPLDKALADGDPVQAVILATGANADGGRKSGITIPSQAGQAELMRSVLQRAGIEAARVDYVEAHGTGTSVGDPIEASAIGEVYGLARHGQADPLPVASVKTHLGHLEPASGMAGLVKSVLVLQNRAVPAMLHLQNPNPQIDFAALGLQPVTELTSLARPDGQPLVAGVNSFGFGGANAHVLLQEYQPDKHLPVPKVPVAPPLFLSARTLPALRDMAGRMAACLADTTYYDLAYTTALRRETMECQLALPADETAAMQAVLGAFAAGENPARLVQESRFANGRLAFVYSGNGAQWVGMAVNLLDELPRFAALITELDRRLQPHAGFSALAELRSASKIRFDDTAVAQPLLFAIQVALTQWLAEQGIHPYAVTGHSVGEVAAAWAAGALTLDQAVEVICVRSACQALTRGSGRMAAVNLSADAAQAILQAEGLTGIAIAGYNSAANITLTGSADQLQKFSQIMEQRDIFCKLLDLDYAFHSPQMEPIRDRLLTSLAALRPQAAVNARFVSSVTGNELDGAQLDAAYWWRNVRDPVLFGDACAALTRLECAVLVEIGPHAILQRYIKESLELHGVKGKSVPLMLRENASADRLQQVSLQLHLLTAQDRKVWFPLPGRHVVLPNYPWQRERHWLPDTTDGYRLIERRRMHALLGWRLPETQLAWENILDPMTDSWLVDHQVGGAVVLPGAAYAEMALAAAREWLGGDAFDIEELEILLPVVFDGEHGRTLRLEIQPRDGSFTIRGRERLSHDEWATHAVGRIAGPALVQTTPPPLPAAGQAIAGKTHYQHASQLGLDYGPVFRTVAEVTLAGDELHARFDSQLLPGGEMVLHPALLDGCFQSLVNFFADDIRLGQGQPLLPVRMGRLRIYRAGRPAGFCTRLTRRGMRSVQAEFYLLDEAGNVLGWLSDCRFRAATLGRGLRHEPGVWQIQPRLVPHQHDSLHSPMPDNAALLDQLTSWFIQGEPHLQRETYFTDMQPLNDALSLSFCLEALRELNRRDPDRLQLALAGAGLAHEVQPLLSWMREALLAEGLLEDTAAGWQISEDGLPPAADIWRTLLAEYPVALPELALAGQVGLHLADLLTGETSLAEFSRQMVASPARANLCVDAPVCQGTRMAVAKLVAETARTWPAQRRLRVLEIPPGGSDLPLLLKELLPASQFDCVLAHGDASIRAHLLNEYGDEPGVTVAGLDPETGLQSDVALPQYFDLVIVQHCLHKSDQPASLLGLLRGLLAGNGLLVLAERSPDLLTDLIFGCDEGWWQDNGLLPPSSRLRHPAAWQSLLQSRQFADIATWREPANEQGGGTYLLLARRADDPLPTIVPPAGHLVLADTSAVSRQQASTLADTLALAGVPAALAEWPVDGDCAMLLDWLAGQSASQLVYCAGVDAAMPAGQAVQAVTACFALIRGLAGVEHPPALTIMTNGGAATSDAPSVANPPAAAIWGLVRTALNEYPQLVVRLVDCSLGWLADGCPAELLRELQFPDTETEVVLSQSGRHGLRMRKTGTPASNRQVARYRLDFLVPGQLRNLTWLEIPEPELQPNQVEVQPVATGLNFRDVMYLMGLLPDEAVEKGFAGASLGLECAGVVTRVGEAVTGFAPGDEVMGFGSACFASHMLTTDIALARKPAEWSFAAAATVPTVFFTVYYALVHLARLQAGERVLIHGGAGGVGIAAIQLARHLGAEVFATAGSAEKRDFVALLGADHVLDSRSLDFAEQILAMTDQQGVDVVLNSLAGEAVRRNLRVLKPFGRFLELGKRDFYENTPLGLRPFRDNISYFGIDADQLLVARPELAQQLFADMMALFHEGALMPLPHRVFGVGEVVEAFRTMQQARHIGKLVVDMQASQPRVMGCARERLQFSGQRSWLVTGGTAGFGLATARWLVERGVRHLALVSRRGEQTPGAVEARQELQQLGVQVELLACDVAEESAVREMLQTVAEVLPPLEGIVHAAMVLDDALMNNLDAARFTAVMHPKVLGAVHLDRLTRDIGLDYFILYSSVTTLIGNPGQAAYVAANTWLENLAISRREQGLPALCVGWGPIDDAGYLTRNQAVKDGLAARLGSAPLKTRDAFHQLETLLLQNVCLSTIADFDWPTLARMLPSSGVARFESLRRHAGQASQQGSAEDFACLLVGKSAGEVAQMVRDLVVDEVAHILCTLPDRVDAQRSLHDMGLDSLMGVELALSLEKRTGIRLPAMMLNEGPTVEKLAARMTEKLLASEAVPETSTMSELVHHVVTQHGEHLSGEELASTVQAVEQQITGKGKA